MEKLGERQELKKMYIKKEVNSWKMDVSESETEVVAFFYKKQKSKSEYLRKETENIVISQNISLMKLKTTFW